VPDLLLKGVGDFFKWRFGRHADVFNGDASDIHRITSLRFRDGLILKSDADDSENQGKASNRRENQRETCNRTFFFCTHG
jgi:hypothetical protein